MLTVGQIKFRNEVLLRNLRSRWSKELERFSDERLVTIYNEFYFSDYAGNNDERFLEWCADEA